MGHIQNIIERRTRAQAVTPPAPVTLPDLPGINRREQQAKSNKEPQKREYNRALKDLRQMAKQHKSARGEKKRAAGARVADIKSHMEHLLTQIGTYASDEKMHGFKEDGHEF